MYLKPVNGMMGDLNVYHKSLQVYHKCLKYKGFNVICSSPPLATNQMKL